MDKHEATLAWEGDSRKVLRSFPKDVRNEIGLDLRRVQDGKIPHDSKPMRSIGQGVFELRQRDENGWYRLLYLAKIENRIHVLHSFVKKSAKTPKNDLNIATRRLKAVRARLQEEKKNARKNK